MRELGGADQLKDKRQKSAERHQTHAGRVSRQSRVSRQGERGVCGEKKSSCVRWNRHGREDIVWGGSGVDGAGAGGGAVKKGRTKCPHSRQRSKGKECDGATIYEKNRQLKTRKQCDRSGICEHNSQRSKCKSSSLRFVLAVLRGLSWRNLIRARLLIEIFSRVISITCETEPRRACTVTEWLSANKQT